MRILLVGASGFIGRHLAAALRDAGHAITGAGRNTPATLPATAPSGAHAGNVAGNTAGWCTLDYAALDTPAAWLPHIDGFDAVIHCIGVLRADDATFERLHHAIPAALFSACAQAGVGRVIHLSALGSTPDAATPYWRSKGRGDAALRATPLAYTIVRPSLVYGGDSASSRLFRALATMPLLAMPADGGVQPVHIDDLCAAVAALLRPEHAHLRELDATGPRALPMRDYLACLRRGMAAGSVVTLPLPVTVARAAAAIAALHPSSPLTPDALTMLEHGNTADATAMRTLVGTSLRDPATFAAPDLKPAAVLAWTLPLATLALAMLWLWTAWVSWFGWPHADSHAWLAACGVPAAWREPMLAGASLLDAAIGCALLIGPRRWLWPAQLALVGGYTLIMTVCLHPFWLHPFGPLSKNLPILALLLLLWRLHPAEKH